MKKYPVFDSDFWFAFMWFLIACVVICFLPSFLVMDGQPDFSHKGEIGDTIGGIMGPFVAMVAAGLTFIAFWVQYKANIQQRQDISVERFERNLFELIHIQQDIVNGLLIQRVDANSKVLESQQGRDVFQFVYETGKDHIPIQNVTEHMTIREALAMSDEVKFSLSTIKNMWFLDHYFRHLYRIFKYIDDGDDYISDEMKYKYASIVRASLSQYELIMLFYNGFSHPKFKGLVEKYALLNNIRTDLLASSNDKELYSSKLQANYGYERDENRDMRGEYRKSAFVRRSI